MEPTAPRRLVILTEGEFGPHHAKTAWGVIRYGRDEIVAILDSTIAGRNAREWLPGHDIPAVATLDEAFAIPGRPRPDALLIGIAPTGGRLPDAWRAILLEAIRAGLELHSGLHTLLGDDPEIAAAAAAAGVRIVDYRRAPDRMDCAVGRRHLPGPAGDPHGRHRLRDRQDVRRARAPPGRPRGRRSGRLRPQRPDRHDDRRLGRGRGSRHQRLPQRDRRVARRAGRGDGGLDPRRGPGLAGPPGLQRRDAGPDPRRDAARDGAGPQGRPRRPRLRPPAGPVLPDRAAPAVHRAARADRRDRGAVEGGRGRRQHVARRGRGRGEAGDRRGRRRDGAPGRRPGPLRRGPAVGRGPARPWTRFPGSRRHGA